MQETPKNIRRPFFIAASEDNKDGNRPCHVNSESVCSIRPIYQNGRPQPDQTLLLTAHGSSDGGRLTVYAPYPVVKRIFAEHGYEFIGKDALAEATRAWLEEKNTQQKSPRAPA